MSENQPGTDPAANTPDPAAAPQPPAAPAAPAGPAQQAAPAYAAAPSPAYAAAPSKGMAIAALCCGIGGILFAFLLALLGYIGGALGLIFGIIALRKGQPRGLALGGIITGAVALVFAVISSIIGVILVTSMMNSGGY